MLDLIETDAQKACERLAVACYSLMDQGRYEESAALFTEDAVWVRGGKPVAGRDAILSALHKRPESDLSRHLITNVMVEVTSDSEGSGTACFVPMRGTKREDGTVPTPPMANIGDLAFKFRREREGWKIAYLKPTMIFTP